MGIKVALDNLYPCLKKFFSRSSNLYLLFLLTYFLRAEAFKINCCSFFLKTVYNIWMYCQWSQGRLREKPGPCIVSSYSLLALYPAPLSAGRKCTRMEERKGDVMLCLSEEGSVCRLIQIPVLQLLLVKRGQLILLPSPFIPVSSLVSTSVSDIEPKDEKTIEVSRV